jgi:photosystem II stability/assembly factor-like uncharacterized protein
MATASTRRWPPLAVAVAALIAAAAASGTALAGSGNAHSPGIGHDKPDREGVPVADRLPPPVWLASVQMTSASTGWALRFTGNPASPFPVSLVLARTTDGGRRWSGVAPLPAGSGPPSLLDAVTGSRAWLVTGTRSHTFVLSTRNGGTSWTRSAPLPAGGAKSLSFFGTQRGWLLQSLGAAAGSEWVALYRTVDAGLRWSLVAETSPPPTYGTSSSGIPTGCDKAGITFSSSRTGWLTGYCTTGDLVLVSTDAGSRWRPQPLPLTSAACAGGCFINPPQFFGRTGFLIVSHWPRLAYLLVSTDGGVRWQFRRLPAGAGIYPQIRFFGPRTGIVVPTTSQATIGDVFYLSANGGRTWRGVAQGMRFTVLGTSIGFVTTRIGFACCSYVSSGGAPPDEYLTSNSGHTWQAFAPLLG